MLQRTFGSDGPFHQRAEWLRWLLVSGMFTLMLASWRLWWSSTDFPQVPWFDWACHVPLIVDQLMLLILAGGLTIVFFTNPQASANQWGLLTFAMSASGLVILNQHRTQPWMYQLILMALVLASAPARQAIPLLRLLTVTIYFYSGLSKLNFSFSQGMVHQFWRMGISILTGGELAIDRFSYWPFLLPLGEIVVSLLLSFPASRRVGLGCACAMHAALLAILGPWGMNHQSGVLVWNAFFIVLNLVLFARGKIARGTSPEMRPAFPAETSDLATPGRRQRLGGVLASILVGWAVIWPCFEPLGFCDVWPAWGLYADHGERLVITVTESGVVKLAPKWRPYLGKPESRFSEGADDRIVRVDSAALQIVHAPVYPANRFLIGIALRVAEESSLKPDEISIVWKSAANRWTGVREELVLANLAEIQQMADQCWFNARPRTLR